MIEGGCFCGNIRYAIAQPSESPYIVANCHCSMCRRISAAPFVTWMVVPKTAFNYTQGVPKTLHSSAKGTRYFCDNCGTPIACILADQAHDIDIPTGSLDRPDDYPAIFAVHEDSKLSWLAQTEVTKKK